MSVNLQSACPHALNVGGILREENKSQKLNIYMFIIKCKNGNAEFVILRLSLIVGIS